MAYSAVPNPMDALRRVQPRTGPTVQNGGGLAANTATLAARPPGTPGQTAAPGPPPLTPPPMAQPQAQPAGSLPMAGQPASQPQATAAATPTPAGQPIPKELPPQVPTPPPPPATPGPAAKVPTPPAPAAPAAPTPDLYGRSGGNNAPTGSLEDQLRQYITNTMNGVTSDAFINRAKNQLASATGGQQAQAVNQINDDAIRRGLFSSGIPSEQAAAAGRAAQGSFATGLSNILQGAEQQNISAREGAANQLSGLLGQNRAWDQYTQQRADANRGGGGPGNFTYVDPDTGESYDIPLDSLQGIF